MAQVHGQLGLSLDVQLDWADAAEIRPENVVDGEREVGGGGGAARTE